MFDTKDFYPSIKEKLPWDALRFAKCHISISSRYIETIFHAKESLI